MVVSFMGEDLYLSSRWWTAWYTGSERPQDFGIWTGVKGGGTRFFCISAIEALLSRSV